MSYDKDHIKNGLEIDDIYTLVEELGGNPTRHGETLIIDTICHHGPGEGSHKLYYFDNTKLFRCFTDCGCYFDIFALLIKAYQIQYGEEWSLAKTIAYVANRFGFEAFEENIFDGEKIEDWKLFQSIDRTLEKENAKKKDVSLKVFDEGILKTLPYLKILPWMEEGILEESLKRFEIKYNPKDCQVIIPHRNEDNQLVGIRGRSMVTEEAETFGKYRPAILNGKMYNHPLGFCLYGLNLTKENISTVKKAIVFEAEKSVMLYDSYFGPENNIAVACCGSSFSAHQFKLLLDLGVQEIILAYDRQYKEVGDNDFRKHIKNIETTANKLRNYVVVSCLFDKTNLLDFKSAPIDHGKQTFLELFKNRIYL